MTSVLFVSFVLLSFFSGGSGEIPKVLLYNAAVPGLLMPAVGLGTGGYGAPGNISGEHWDDQVAQAAVSTWLLLGGTRIDTSLDYHTQKGIGQAIINSQIDRSNIFITSKTGPAYPLGYNETLEQTNEILEQLQTNYVDLLLLHWPGEISPPAKLSWPCFQQDTQKSFKKCRQDSWRALEEVFRAGKARAIGVSNFEINHLKDIYELSSLLPAVNQVEFHPYWHEDDLLSYCKAHNILLNGYSSVGCPDHMSSPDNPSHWPTQIIQQPSVDRIAKKYQKTPAQVLLRWSWQQEGVVVNARSLNKEHQEENINFFDFTLTPEEMRELSQGLPKPENPKVCTDPSQIR